LRREGRNRAAGTSCLRPDSGRPQPIRCGKLKAAAVARLVDGQNAQKAKIARNAGCEHNRDAATADP